jgi:hypothetical protein
MGDPVCQGSCLRWFVRAALTVPNAPADVFHRAARWGLPLMKGLGVLNHPPWFFPGPLGDPVCLGRHLRWFVRAALTTPRLG